MWVHDTHVRTSHHIHSLTHTLLLSNSHDVEAVAEVLDAEVLLNIIHTGLVACSFAWVPSSQMNERRFVTFEYCICRASFMFTSLLASFHTYDFLTFYSLSHSYSKIFM